MSEQQPVSAWFFGVFVTTAPAHRRSSHEKHRLSNLSGGRLRPPRVALLHRNRCHRHVLRKPRCGHSNAGLRPLPDMATLRYLGVHGHEVAQPVASLWSAPILIQFGRSSEFERDLIYVRRRWCGDERGVCLMGRDRYGSGVGHVEMMGVIMLASLAISLLLLWPTATSEKKEGLFSQMEDFLVDNRLVWIALLLIGPAVYGFIRLCAVIVERVPF